MYRYTDILPVIFKIVTLLSISCLIVLDTLLPTLNKPIYLPLPLVCNSGIILISLSLGKFLSPESF